MVYVVCVSVRGHLLSSRLNYMHLTSFKVATVFEKVIVD